eukprot:767698-Hanusia_phi.AAC.1
MPEDGAGDGWLQGREVSEGREQEEASVRLPASREGERRGASRSQSPRSKSVQSLSGSRADEQRRHDLTRELLDAFLDRKVQFAVLNALEVGQVGLTSQSVSEVSQQRRRAG